MNCSETLNLLFKLSYRRASSGLASPRRLFLLHLLLKNFCNTARELAMEGGCEHEAPLERWDSKDPTRAETCGRHQASIVAGIDVQVTLPV